jgi:hypothetical protein
LPRCIYPLPLRGDRGSRDRSGDSGRRSTCSKRGPVRRPGTDSPHPHRRAFGVVAPIMQPVFVNFAQPHRDMDERIPVPAAGFEQQHANRGVFGRLACAQPATRLRRSRHRKNLQSGMWLATSPIGGAARHSNGNHSRLWVFGRGERSKNHCTGARSEGSGSELDVFHRKLGR